MRYWTFLLLCQLWLPLISGAAVCSEKPDLKSCTKNPVLSIISALKATAFCSSFLDIHTSTVIETTTSSTTESIITTTTETESVPSTLTISTTTTWTETSSITISPATASITTTVSTTQTITSTSITITTPTTTITVTSYIRNAKRSAIPEAEVPVRRSVRIPSGLAKFASSMISTACQCYVKTPTVTSTATAIDTSKTTSTVVISTTETYVAETSIIIIGTTVTALTTTNLPQDTATATSTATITQSTTTTSTSTAPASTVTVTVNAAGSFTLRYGPSTHCVYNHYHDYIQMASIFSYNAAFQQCASLCSQRSYCKGIFFWEDLDFPGTWWCLVDDATFMANYIQCSLPFAGQLAFYDAP